MTSSPSESTLQVPCHAPVLSISPERQTGPRGISETTKSAPGSALSSSPVRGGHDKIVGLPVYPSTCLLRADKIKEVAPTAKQAHLQPPHTLSALQELTG